MAKQTSKKRLADSDAPPAMDNAPQQHPPATPRKKLGRPPAPTLGKTFDDNTAYMIGLMKKGAETTALQFPDLRNDTVRRVFGRQIKDAGADTTYTFFKKNPLEFTHNNPKEFWYIYIDNNGVLEYFDKGQFENIKPPAPNSAPALADDTEQFRLPPNPGMGDLLNALLVNNKKGGGDIAQQVLLTAQQRELDSIKSERDQLRSELASLRENYMNIKIEQERLIVSKQMEIDKAVADAKEATWNEANAMLEKYKAENAPKGGLSGLFDDPQRFADTVDKTVLGLGMLMKLPEVYKQIKGINEQAQQPQPTTTEQQPQPLMYQNGVQQ